VNLVATCLVATVLTLSAAEILIMKEGAKKTDAYFAKYDCTVVVEATDTKKPSGNRGISTAWLKGYAQAKGVNVVVTSPESKRGQMIWTGYSCRGRRL
jgi:hypothetical protein